jgi:hypothetical protein
MATRREL